MERLGSPIFTNILLFTIAIILVRWIENIIKRLTNIYDDMKKDKTKIDE